MAHAAEHGPLSRRKHGGDGPQRECLAAYPARPLCPTTDRSWGFNNRTVTFRIRPGDAKARQLEHRSGGADVNPYLATALILGSMAEGLEQQIAAADDDEQCL